MSPPLVSVICLCYNQARFVQEAIDSVLAQTYPAVELIVVDDASSDASVTVIQKIVKQHPAIQFLSLTENVGNCSAFNRGLALARGEYLIDLAADDVLLPNRIVTGVLELQKAGEDFGVHFSDAEWIDENGKHLHLHSEKFPHNSIPQGDIYRTLISRYFICPPTVMFTRAVADQLGGYDETLTYEDFDFWIRSSRKFKYAYSPQVLMKKRVTASAMASTQFKLFNIHSRTTYKVCEKILQLNKTVAEQQALSQRIFYEIKLNLRLLNVRVVIDFLVLWFKNRKLRYDEHG